MRVSRVRRRLPADLRRSVAPVADRGASPASPVRASLSTLCLFCALCWLFAAGAIAAPGRLSRERSSRTARVCHRGEHRQHRRCPALHARGKSHRKRKHGAASAPTHAAGGGSAGSGSGPSAPWTVVPPSVAPGSTPGTGGAGGAGTTPSGPGGAAPGEPSAPAGPPHVEVTAEDTAAYRFVLSRPAVPAGQVIVEFVNHGQDEHNLHAVEPVAGTEAGSLPNTAPNAHPSLTLNLHAGSYTFFCSIKDHEAKGMKATLLVE
jgi:plastocyanin